MSQKSTPLLVSMIMPAYNCAPWIKEAVESLTNQTYTNLEIVVVDDCSSDGTWEKLQEMAKADPRIRPFRNDQNLRIVGTLNRAVRESKGQYLARMDGDDVRLLDSIEKQAAFLDAHPDVVVVGGTAEVCDQNMNTLNKRSYQQEDAEIRKRMFRYSPFCHGTIMMRADALEPDPYRYDWAEDYDLYFRLGKVGKFANLPDVFYKIRTHPGSVSRTKARYQEKLTLYLRLKAIFEYGYKMTAADKWYFAGQFLSMYLMTTEMRFWLFNRIRASR